jgi:GGDEF domain-containing protein
VAILGAAVLGAFYAPKLPPELYGLGTYGPYAVALAAALVAGWFNRERAFVVALSLLAAFALNDRMANDLTFILLATLVPLNALVALAVAERGVRFGRAWRWIALLILEAGLVWFLDVRIEDHGPFEHWLLRSPPTPLLARLAFAAAFAAAIARAWPNHTPLEIGVAGALVAFFIACEWILEPRVFGAFVAASSGILIVSVMQESYRMAFRDALTGLPNRRALEEQLRALAPPYTVAMVDVDHFKKFNDTHGHDIGDQVLKLVAARLAEVGGGGRAFRYGGEEFTVLFPGAHLADVMSHLEALRASVEFYKMTIRGPDRPKGKEEGQKRRSVNVSTAEDFARTDQLVSVTVSIGAAEPGRRLKTTAHVLKGADEALYRAKERGRNRVSR